MNKKILLKVRLSYEANAGWARPALASKPISELCEGRKVGRKTNKAHDEKLRYAKIDVHLKTYLIATLARAIYCIC